MEVRQERPRRDRDLRRRCPLAVTGRRDPRAAVTRRGTDGRPRGLRDYVTIASPLVFEAASIPMPFVSFENPMDLMIVIA